MFEISSSAELSPINLLSVLLFAFEERDDERAFGPGANSAKIDFGLQLLL